MCRMISGLSRAMAWALLPMGIAVAASPALAQQAGVYTGTNNEGYEVQVVVEPVNGTLAVVEAATTGAVYCYGQQAATYGVLVGLAGQAIVDDYAKVAVLSSTLYFDDKVTFDGATVTGTIRFAIPMFAGGDQMPKKACSAKTMKQTFTATLGGNANVHVAPAGTVLAAPVVATAK